MNDVVRFEVAPGASVRGVINQLGAQGVIADARAVQLYLRLKGFIRRSRPGPMSFRRT